MFMLHVPDWQVGLAPYGRSNREWGVTPEVVLACALWARRSHEFHDHRLRWRLLYASVFTASMYDGAGHRAAWPLGRARARSCGAGVRPCRPRQML
eukprot:6213581-Pleurochrysis_carterae.AAC.3